MYDMFLIIVGVTVRKPDDYHVDVNDKMYSNSVTGAVMCCR